MHQPQAPKFWLVTHSTELLKPTNTGQLLLKLAALNPHIAVQQVEWQRKQPHHDLLAALSQQAVLLYPNSTAMTLSYTQTLAAQQNLNTQLQYAESHASALNQQFAPNQQFAADQQLSESQSLSLLSITAATQYLSQYQHIILLDATWQLAHKIYKQSAYLQTLPSIQLADAPPSQYQLRRNQREVGWCTAEIAIMLLQLCQQPAAAAQLQQLFSQFNHADRNRAKLVSAKFQF